MPGIPRITPVAPAPHHRAVSLFSNCGAGDVGYAKAGFKFEVMAELDPRRLAVSLLNHPGATGIAGDLRKTWKKVVEAYRLRAGTTRPALVAACPPCQGMSTARSGRGKEADADAGSRDKRNLLVTVVSSVVKELNPDFVVLENVQAFLTKRIRHPRTRRPISAAKFLVEDLGGDYEVFPVLLNLCDYGVPQTRKRTFLTFVRRTAGLLKPLTDKKAAPYPKPSHAPDFNGQPVTLREALARMRFPVLDARDAKSATCNGHRGMHSVPVWTDHRYPMVAAIPRHRGGSAWQNDTCPRCGKVNVGADDAVCPLCSGPLARPVVRKKDGTFRLVNGFRSSSYSRMKSDEPAATITTASGHVGSDHTIHPYQNRLLSTLECARLQTFPADFAWGDTLEKYGPTNVRDMVGEAVPPLFTRKHGKVLVSLLRGEFNQAALPKNDQRVRRAEKKLGLKVEKEKKQKRARVA